MTHNTQTDLLAIEGWWPNHSPLSLTAPGESQVLIEFAVLDEFFEPVVADDRIEALDCVGVELARDWKVAWLLAIIVLHSQSNHFSRNIDEGLHFVAREDAHATAHVEGIAELLDLVDSILQAQC